MVYNVGVCVCVCAYKHVQTKSLHDFARFSKQFITETLGQEHSDTWLVKHGSIWRREAAKALFWS